MGYRGVPAPDRKVVGRHDTLADKSLMRREAQERVRRLGEIWTGPATEVTFAWAHMIGSMRARRSRERPRNEGRTRWREGFGPAGVFYGPPVASSARELFMLGGSWGYGPAVIFYGPSRLPA